jgi:hypothetical protein
MSSARGEGYDAHIDPYDVTILLLAGTVETLGRTVTAPSVICYQAGEPHGITNVGRRAGPLSCVRVHADHLGTMQQQGASGDEWRFPFAAC